MKLDSNRAWKEATAIISANRDVLWAMAGVFFLLPSLALNLLMPQPEPAPGLTPEQTINMAMEFYGKSAPYLIIMAVLSMVGTLAILTLCTDRTRPTVGQAIGQGFSGTLSYIGAQLLMGLGVGLVGGLLVGLSALTGSAVAAALAIGVVAVAVIYLSLRLMLVAPVIAVEGRRNPIEILKRSWALTQGNAGRIIMFLLLLVVAFLVVMSVVMLVVGLIVAFVLSPETAKIVTVVISAAFGASFTLYMIAVLAAIHRQMAGPSVEILSAAFD